MFGHMMDVGGKVPGSQVDEAPSIWEEGLRIPPMRIFDRGELNETRARHHAQQHPHAGHEPQPT